MQLKDLIQEYDICEKYQDSERTDKLLSVTLKYILENEWYFLLEIIYPFDMDNHADIKSGNLVICQEVMGDGFALIKSLPIINVLNAELKDSEIGQKEKMNYLKKLLPLIPYTD